VQAAIAGADVTIIAVKAGIMAADTQLSGGSSKCQAQKLVRLPDGGVAGGCGVWGNAYAGLKFLSEGGSEDDDVKPDLDGSTILIAKPDGSLWLLDGRFPAYPILDKTMAIGCGADAAIMAMALGKSALESVGLVTHQDIMCGEPVQTMEVMETHEYPEVTTHKNNNKKAKG
jgi:hypothetical protein